MTSQNILPTATPTAIDNALRAAQGDSAKFGDAFVLAVLNSELLVPVRDSGVKPGQGQREAVLVDQEMLVIDHDIGPIVPAFDELKKLQAWMKGAPEIHHIKVMGGPLILVLDPSVALALNPQHDPNYVFHKEDLARLRAIIKRKPARGEVVETGDEAAPADVTLTPDRKTAPKKKAAPKKAAAKKAPAKKAAAKKAPAKKKPAPKK